MQVKHMTLEQVKRIMENNYLGDPSKGYGTDYGDYKEEIEQHYWHLMEKRNQEKLKEQLEAYNRE